MLRDVDISQISDGKKYRAEDMVKLGCKDCEGCSSCCHEVSDTIIIDPYDLYEMSKGLHTNFNSLVQDELSLRVVDGMVMPMMNITADKGCLFLREDGRCRIHDFRPGFCRLFPLGRVYDEDEMYYILQKDACPNAQTKVKIKKWLDIPELPKYEKYVKDWHEFQKLVRENLSETDDDQTIHNAAMAILNMFYVKEYDITESFYPQFYERLGKMKDVFG